MDSGIRCISVGKGYVFTSVISAGHNSGLYSFNMYMLAWKSTRVMWVWTKSVRACFIWGCDGCYMCVCVLIGDIVSVVCRK